MNNVKNIISENKIIAVIRGVYGEKLYGLLNALKLGKIRVAEITFGDKSDAETRDVIADAVQKFGEEMLIGAGTVTTQDRAYYALQAGAKFTVSPDCDSEVIEYVKQRGGFCISGAFTPTEVKHAFVCGADMVKIFPSDMAGEKYFSDLKGPFPNFPLVAFGGITRKNIRSFLDAGAVGAGVGGDLIRKDLIAAGDFAQIKEIAKQFADAVK